MIPLDTPAGDCLPCLGAYGARCPRYRRPYVTCYGPLNRCISETLSPCPIVRPYSVLIRDPRGGCGAFLPPFNVPLALRKTGHFRTLFGVDLCPETVKKQKGLQGFFRFLTPKCKIMGHF